MIAKREDRWMAIAEGNAYTRAMRVSPRAQKIGTVLYTLPFLGIIWISVFYMWAGNAEMILAGVALASALLFLLGVQWCRYLVATFSILTFLVLSAVPFLRGTEGRYFWAIWIPTWLVSACATYLVVMPTDRSAIDAA